MPNEESAYAAACSDLEKKCYTQHIDFSGFQFFVQLLQAFWIENIWTFQEDEDAQVITDALFQATNCLLDGLGVSGVTQVTKEMEKFVLAVSVYPIDINKDGKLSTSGLCSSNWPV